jgi:hypothetical protein
MAATDLETVTAAVVTNVSGGIASATTDGTTVTATDISKQIEAAKFIAGETAKTNGGLGIRMFKIKPPGTIY